MYVLNTITSFVHMNNTIEIMNTVFNCIPIKPFDCMLLGDNFCTRYLGSASMQF